MYTRPDPKAPPRPKKAPHPLQRSRMRRKAPRRLSSPASDPAYLAFVRTLQCRFALTEFGRFCCFVVEAHHAGPFHGMSKDERFGWSLVAIAQTQRRRAEEMP